MFGKYKLRFYIQIMSTIQQQTNEQGRTDKKAPLIAKLLTRFKDIDDTYILQLLKYRLEQRVAGKSEHIRAYVSAQIDLFEDQLQQAGII